VKRSRSRNISNRRRANSKLCKTAATSIGCRHSSPAGSRKLQRRLVSSPHRDRTAMTASVRRMARPYRLYRNDPLESEFSTDMFRTVVLASTLTAAVIGVVMLCFG
jgi:hypothetical protein